jgi:hypothetical protein
MCDSCSQRPLPKQHTKIQERNIRAYSGISILDADDQVAADLRCKIYIYFFRICTTVHFDIIKVFFLFL